MSQPNSPRGRDIRYVEGDPDAVVARGIDITTLGDQMIASADLLQRVAEAQDGQHGKAVDKLRDVVGDSYELLRTAGHMYRPTGPIIRDYGIALREVQPTIRTRVDSCSSLWSTYASLPGAVEPRGTDGPGQPEAGSAEAELQAEQDAAKRAALEAWEAEASAYDASFDTWESAFTSAANQIGDVLDDAVKDGFWDYVDKAVEWAQTVLAIAGIALAVLGMIIGGPIIAALAAIVAVVTLALTIYQAIRGDKGGWDVAMAVVGVIPIGKLGMLWNKGGAATFAKTALKSFDPATYKAGSSALGEVMRSGSKWSTFMAQGDGILSMAKGERGISVLTSLVFGKTSDGTAEMFTQHFKNLAGERLLTKVVAAPFAFGGAVFELAYTPFAQAVKYNGWWATLTGGESWKKQAVIPDTPIGDIPILDVFF